MPLIPGSNSASPDVLSALAALQSQQAPDPGNNQPGNNQSPDAGDPAQHMRIALEHLQAALVNEPDDADSQALSRLISGLYQIVANRQKEQDQVLGNPNTARMLRRG